MFEFRIDLSRERSGRIPKHLAGRRLDPNSMQVIYWGRLQNRTESGDYYSLYPLEFSNQPGFFTFGIKETYTPHGYAPNVCVTLDLTKMEWCVDRMDSNWEHAVESMEEDGKSCAALFHFLRPEEKDLPRAPR